MENLTNKLESLLYGGKVKKKTYEPYFFYMTLKNEIGHVFIGSSIAYTQDDAQKQIVDWWIKNLKEENEGLKEKDIDKITKNNTNISLFENNQYKVELANSIKLTDLLSMCSDYFELGEKKKVNVIDKLKQK